VKLTIVYDNLSISPDYQSGWGLSVLVNDSILFDTGDDGERLLSNLDKLKISPRQIQKVVISHDHWDHQGGLRDLLKANPAAEVHYLPDFSDEFKQKIEGCGNPVYADNAAYELENGVFATEKIGFSYKGRQMVERAIICKGKAAVLLCGCSHPGVLTVRDKAEQSFPNLSINGVVGGFHLESKNNAQILELYSEYKKAFPALFVPLHCSGLYIRELCGCSFAAGNVIEI
jgi:7,8-dihydropterin-6-yl-methyl-4-(beta-D-ribofuranosyl)aminobenzene 5'-phosphate synthase